MLIIYKFIINIIFFFSPIIILVRLLKKKKIQLDLKKSFVSFQKKELKVS